ncbi:unnamed protein product [Ascophyllum nodosum]
MRVRETLCWVAGATAMMEDNTKVITEYDMCEITAENFTKLAAMVPDGLAEASTKVAELEIVAGGLISGLWRAKALRDEVQQTLNRRKQAAKAEADDKISLLAAKAEAEDKVSLLRMQIKTLKKERNMDLKLLEGATRKINTLRQKMAELKEERRAINPVKKKRRVNPPCSSVLRGPSPSADTRPQGVRGRGTKMEANVWAAILKAERNRSRDGGGRNGGSRGATGFPVQDFSMP